MLLAPTKAMPAMASRMPRVTIDREALNANWKTLAALQPNARTGAAVKANGYGLGAAGVAQTLHGAGCRDFFVAWPEEGVSIRDALRRQEMSADDPNPTSASPILGNIDDAPPGTDRQTAVNLGTKSTPQVRVFVLQGLEPSAVDLHIEHELIPVLSTPDDIAVWREGLSRTHRRTPAALQVETGMNRLGFDRRNAETAAGLAASGDLDLCLVMSHLASADETGLQSDEQRVRFLELSSLFPGLPRSLANSAGVFRGQTFGFDLTRPGIALYGGESGEASKGELKSVATLTAAILQLRWAEAGEAAGYGGAAVLSRRTRIATVGLGYADGYLRAASGAGVDMRQVRPGAEAVVCARRVPVLGRVSMDLTLLDVTDLPEGAVTPGDRAEFFGPNMPIDAVATAAGTIAYELLTGLGSRVCREWRSCDR